MKEDISNLEDSALIELYRNGDTDAFNIIIKRYGNHIASIAYFILRNHALSQDAVQDTLIKAMINIKSNAYQDRGSLKAWLSQIMHNICIDYVRRQNKTLINFSVMPAEFNIINYSEKGPQSPEDIIINKESGDNFEVSINEVLSMINKIPAEQREVLMLRFFHDFSFKEIADYQEVSINTALGRMRYALISLRKKIEEMQRT